MKQASTALRNPNQLVVKHRHARASNRKSRNLVSSSTSILCKLRLLPIPQLRRKRHILPRRTLAACLPHRRVILSALHLVLVAHRRPQLVVHALLHRHGVEEIVRPLKSRSEGEILEEVVQQVRLHAAGVDGDGFDIGIAFRELLGEEHVGEFRVAVARVRVVGLHRRGGFVGQEAALGRKTFAGGGEVDDAHIGVGFFVVGGPEEERHEQFGQQGVAHVVRAELDLVAVFGEGGREGHNAGVVDEEVETRAGGEHGGGGPLHGGEGTEVEFEEGDAAFGAGVCFHDLGHGGVEFGARAGGQVEFGRVVFGELQDGFFAEPDVAVGGFRGLVSNVLEADWDDFLWIWFEMEVLSR